MADFDSTRTEAIEVMAAVRYVPGGARAMNAAILDALLAARSSTTCETCGGHKPRWQCSGCREKFDGERRDMCPSCWRSGYWTGSVEPCPDCGGSGTVPGGPLLAALMVDLDEIIPHLKGQLRRLTTEEHDVDAVYPSIVRLFTEPSEVPCEPPVYRARESFEENPE